MQFKFEDKKSFPNLKHHSKFRKKNVIQDEESFQILLKSFQNSGRRELSNPNNDVTNSRSGELSITDDTSNSGLKGLLNPKMLLQF